MNNVLILYNPYYQSDVIEQHLKILISKGKVAFGKIKSKRRDMINSHEAELEQIYESKFERQRRQVFAAIFNRLFKFVRSKSYCRNR